ncbi:MAG: hypothetical protein BWY89_00175 [Bacteroidetes bacterium ADurb.BinA012]|nr:MAG: hypothetical protein BWY89_00175 [Bacteroidetes bacterium ADurb.BinA012]
MVPVTFICIFSWKSNVGMVLSLSEMVGFSVCEILMPNISSADPCGTIFIMLLPKMRSKVSPPTSICGMSDDL